MNSKSKILVALVLAMVLATAGCTAQWIATALEDLPVLTQMALNIATLVSSLATAQQANSADVAMIQNISAQASRDLNLLQTLYSEYKAAPSTTTLQKIQNVISDLNRNLPALLESAHVSNPTLTTRVTAAVTLILTTVNSFASLMPQARQVPAQRRTAPQTKTSLPRVNDLKSQWNQRVCATSGNQAFDRAFADCTMR